MNFLKILFNPIFLLAVGLHAGFLLIPVAGGSSDQVVPAPDPEGESITVTRIPPKQTNPAPASGQVAAPKPNRPGTVAPPTATRTAAAGTRNQRPKAQGTVRPATQSASRAAAGGQNATNRAQDSSNRGRSGNGQEATSPPRNTIGELSGLPVPAASRNNGAVDSVPVTVSSAPTATQAPPTLTALRPGADSQAVPQVLRAFLARFQYSLLETRDIATEKAQQDWLKQLADQPGLTVAAPQPLEKPLKISYPLTVNDNGPRQFRSCLNPAPKQGLVGVVVDADELLSTDPALLRGSGYGFLNDIAIAKISDYAEFPDANSPQIYTIPVEVDYDANACVSLVKLGVRPAETSQFSESSTPPEGSRNPLAAEDAPNSFRQ